MTSYATRRDGGSPSVAQLRALARLWLAGATGRVSVRNLPGASVALGAGGLLDAADVPMLAEMVSSGEIVFAPCAVGGRGDRGVMVRLLATLAMAGVAEDPPATGWVGVSLTAPADRVAELGLLGETWMDGEGQLRARPDRRLAALERLGVVRVRGPLAPAERRDAEVMHAEEDLFASHLDEDDLAWIEGLDDLADEFDFGVRTAQDLIRRGQWAAAERTLLALRDQRLDSPEVLLLLVTAKIGDAQRVNLPGLEDARRWLALASQLAGTDPSLNLLFEEARQNVRHAETILSRARNSGPHPRIAFAREA